MDVAQTMIGHHLQHPLGPGAILYPGKGSAWQTVVTSLPSMVDIPKESIIANMDFTTTSVIAKRRLSSKKRKKVASQLQQSSEGGASGSSDKCSSCSPMGSANGSPAVTSTTCTPPAFDSKSNQSQDDLVNRSTSVSVSAQNMMTLSHAENTTSSSARLPHHIGHHPHVAVTTGTGVQFHHHPGVTANGQFISVAPSITSVAYHHPTVATAQTQFANPMLSQLQQELNYRFLQDRSSGVLIAHPNQVDHSHQQQHHLNGLKQHETDRRDNSQTMDTASSSSQGASIGVVKQPGFKWCYAHIAIAKQIQQQQQQRAKELCGSTSSSTTSSVIALDHQSHMTSHMNGGSRAADVAAATIPSVSVAAAAAAAHQQQQQQQQQLALLQMYGLPAAVPAAPMPGSYMAVPYSSVQEVQLRMHQLAAASNVHTGISLVKPVGMDSMARGAATEPMLSLNPGGGATAVQMVNSLQLQAAPFAAAAAGHTVPLAAVAAAPSDLNNAVFHSTTSGQWMAPVPVVGSCIVNPLQPGIMTAPWVK